MADDDDVKAQALARLDDVATLHGGWRGALEAIEAVLQVDAELQRVGERVH